MINNFDTYVLRARVAPAVVSSVPLGICMLATLSWAGVAWPDAKSGIWITGTAFLLISGYMLAAQVGRIGRHRQAELFSLWGGAPLVTALRHKEGTPNWITRERVLATCALRTGIAAPTAKDEESSPQDANDIYHHYQAELKSATRDKNQYPLVFAENVEYGFRRNLWALKKHAIVMNGLAIAAAVVVLMQASHGPAKLIAWVGLASSVIALSMWVRTINQPWVRDAAHAYVQAVLDAALRISSR